MKIKYNQSARGTPTLCPLMISTYNTSLGSVITSVSCVIFDLLLLSHVIVVHCWSRYLLGGLRLKGWDLVYGHFVVFDAQQLLFFFPLSLFSDLIVKDSFSFVSLLPGFGNIKLGLSFFFFHLLSICRFHLN